LHYSRQCTLTLQSSKCFWNRYTVAWPCRHEPSSDRTVLITATCTAWQRRYQIFCNTNAAESSSFGTSYIELAIGPSLSRSVTRLVACLTNVAHCSRVLFLPPVPISRKSLVCRVVLNINPSYPSWLHKPAYLYLQLICSCYLKPRFLLSFPRFASNFAISVGLQTMCRLETY